jgi:hypothetical protein
MLPHRPFPCQSAEHQICHLTHLNPSSSDDEYLFTVLSVPGTPVVSTNATILQVGDVATPKAKFMITDVPGASINVIDKNAYHPIIKLLN